METGSVLILDEIDRGSNKIMCLQGIMEGSEFIIKRTGELIKPNAGFTIIATANTKGNGDETGQFSASTIIDDAFLERFVGVIDEQWATESLERKMLLAHFEEVGLSLDDDNELLVKRLCRWAKTLRKSFDQGGIEHVISTRRLVHILTLYSTLGDIKLSCKMATAKFDEDTKIAMIESFNMITGNEVDDEE